MKMMTIISPAPPIKYWCADGCFTVAAGCVTIWNPDSLSSSETGANAGVRCWDKYSFEWIRCQEAIGGIYLSKKKKWRHETSQPALYFHYFKLDWKAESSNAIPSETFFFSSARIVVFWKRDESRPRWNCTNVACSYTRQFYLSSHIL